jgi:hypothetical protein
VAQELRAHGQDRIQAGRRVLLEADQDFDEQLCLLAPVLIAEREQLLELVDQDADVVVAAAAEQFRKRGRRIWSAVEKPADLADATSVAFAGVQRGQRLGEIPQRRFARQHRAGAPCHTASSVLLLEQRQHAGADQGTLAAARIAMNHDQMLTNQAPDDLIGNRLTPEKDWPFVGFERAEARIGRGRKLELERGSERRGGFDCH